MDHQRSKIAGTELRAFLLGAVVGAAALLAATSGVGGGVAVLNSAAAEHGLPGPPRGGADSGRFLAAAADATDAPGSDAPEPWGAVECVHHKTINLPMYYTVPIIAVLVMLSGLFSGLTLGLMGLDVIGLQIVQRGGNKELAKCAAKIAPLRDNGNMLLCTLLLGNVAVNSALSILTADIANGLVGFLVSTTLIVVFGEILPQAACSRYALQVGARSVPIVRLVICLFYFFSKPMSVVLDCLLGREIGMVLSHTELMEMLKLQISLGAVNEKDGEMAKQVCEGAISFRDKSVHQIMTPLEDAYLLSSETRLGYDTIRQIFETGFSRVPVYGTDKNDYLGLLYTKDLMFADPEDEMRLRDFIPIFHRKVETFFPETTLIDALNAMKKGGTHMGLVRQTNVENSTDPRFEMVGVVTLEDIMEEIIQAEIVDETDVYVDVDRGIPVCDGREKDHIDLGVFNPVWRSKREMLSPDEVRAVAAHLSRTVFLPGTEMDLGCKAVEWLAAAAEVRQLCRATPFGVEAIEEEDFIYRYGHLADCCSLVLQGRVAMSVGRDGFRSEAGAFSVLAKGSLLPQEYYYPDFSAHVSTKHVRMLVISRCTFLRAQALDRCPKSLEQAWCALAALSAGEVSRKEAQRIEGEVAESLSPVRGRHGRLEDCANSVKLHGLSRIPHTRSIPSLNAGRFAGGHHMTWKGGTALPLTPSGLSGPAGACASTASTTPPSISSAVASSSLAAAAGASGWGVSEDLNHEAGSAATSRSSVGGNLRSNFQETEKKTQL